MDLLWPCHLDYHVLDLQRYRPCEFASTRLFFVRDLSSTEPSFVSSLSISTSKAQTGTSLSGPGRTESSSSPFLLRLESSRRAQRRKPSRLDPEERRRLPSSSSRDLTTTSSPRGTPAALDCRRLTTRVLWRVYTSFSLLLIASSC